MFLASWACMCSATDSGSGLRTVGSGALSRPSVLTARVHCCGGAAHCPNRREEEKPLVGSGSVSGTKAATWPWAPGLGTARTRTAPLRALAGLQPHTALGLGLHRLPSSSPESEDPPNTAGRGQNLAVGVHPSGLAGAAPDRPVSPAWVLRCTPPASAEVCKLSLPKGSHTQIKQHKHTTQEGKQYADVTT